MKEALVGLIGILLGIGINEFLRRRGRIESYSEKVFKKRLSVYQQLYSLVKTAESHISSILRDEHTPREEKYDAVFLEGLEVMQFTDDNDFYLNDEITVHLGGTFIGAGEIAQETDQERVTELTQSYCQDLVKAYHMIKKEAGIEDIDRLFHKVTKTRHSSPIIEYYRQKKELSKKRL